MKHYIDLFREQLGSDDMHSSPFLDAAHKIVDRLEVLENPKTLSGALAHLPGGHPARLQLDHIRGLTDNARHNVSLLTEENERLKNALMGIAVNCNDCDCIGVDSCDLKSKTAPHDLAKEALQGVE